MRTSQADTASTTAARRILSVQNLTKSFGGVHACESVSLNLDSTEIVGVIGPNGAGKTTVFNCISGFHQADAGEVLLDGGDIASMSPDAIARRGLARTFQNTRPFGSMTLLENVAVGALMKSKTVAAARSKAEELIEFVGLPHKMNSLGSELSTGQRKRLEMARSLAIEPKVLLMDEVTGGVDPGAISGLIELVHRIRREGLAVLIIEHNMEVIRELSDRLVAMHLGEIIAEGDPVSVIENERVIDSYLGRDYAQD